MFCFVLFYFGLVWFGVLFLFSFVCFWLVFLFVWLFFVRLFVCLFVCFQIFRGFPTRMVYLNYILCLRYTILVGNTRNLFVRFSSSPPSLFIMVNFVADIVVAIAVDNCSSSFSLLLFLHRLLLSLFAIFFVLENLS